MTAAADIDAMLAADKTLFGSPRWVQSGPIAALVAGVANAVGLVVGDLSLRLSANVEMLVPRGDAVLVFHDVPIQRLAFRPKGSHVNPGSYPVPPDLRRIRLPAERTRLYRWSDNRVWPRPADHILAGAVLPDEPPTMIDAIGVFLEASGISASIPSPPWQPRLDL